MMNIHCITHPTNLLVQTLSKFEVVRHMEDMLAILSSCFNSLSKCMFEFQKFSVCLESKGNKIIRNVKTHWIFILGLAKKVLEEYNPLVTKMVWTLQRNWQQKKIFL